MGLRSTCSTLGCSTCTGAGLGIGAGAGITGDGCTNSGLAVTNCSLSSCLASKSSDICSLTIGCGTLCTGALSV